MRRKAKLIDPHYRLGELPDIKLPFSVRSVGHYIVKDGWSESLPRYCDFIQFYWCISGTGEFVFDGKAYLLKPGEVCFHRRGNREPMKAASAEWNYRWFTIDGAEADSICDGFGYENEPFFAGTCPEELFVKLNEEIYDSSPFGLRRIGATAYEILARAGGQPEQTDKSGRLVARCIKLIEENYDESETEINLLAEELGVHRSTLIRAFKQKMRMTPLKYLNGFRVQRALTMLRQTNFSVAEVGWKNGFSDPCYFCKVIKKAVGVTPETFRRQ